MRSDSFSACPSVRSHLAVGLVLAFAPLAGWAAPLKHAGEPVKVTLAKISDRTLEVRLQKAGEDAFTLPADATAPGLPREILWQGTDLNEPLRLAFGDYRCELSAEPLKLKIFDSGGASVQSTSGMSRTRSSVSNPKVHPALCPIGRAKSASNHPKGKLLKSVPWKGKTFEVELPS